MYGERGYAVVVPSGLRMRIYWANDGLHAWGRDLLHRIKAGCPVMERLSGKDCMASQAAIASRLAPTEGFSAC